MRPNSTSQLPSLRALLAKDPEISSLRMIHDAALSIVLAEEISIRQCSLALERARDAHVLASDLMETIRVKLREKYLAAGIQIPPSYHAGGCACHDCRIPALRPDEEHA